MKINFGATINDLYGKPVKEDPNKDLTLSSVVCTALLANYNDEQKLSEEEKVLRYRLALRAVEGNEQDMKVEDVALMKKLIVKAFPPLIVGRSLDLIEPQ